MRWRCSISFKSLSFSLPCTIINFLFASFWNHLLFFKNFTETLLRIPLSVIGRCSLVPTCHWLQGKCARINLSQAASGMILQNHRRLYVSIFSVKIAVAGCLKEFIGRIFKICSKDQAKTSVWFLRQLKSGKLSAHAQKVPIYYYQPSKKYSSLDTILLKKQKF
jgi:hypothetical protein